MSAPQEEKQFSQYAMTPTGLRALDDHSAALAKDCPLCEAKAGTECTTVTGHPRATMHASRYVR